MPEEKLHAFDGLEDEEPKQHGGYGITNSSENEVERSKTTAEKWSKQCQRRGGGKLACICRGNKIAANSSI